MIKQQSSARIGVLPRRIVHFARSLPPVSVRNAWFRTKYSLGIPTRSDRSYLVRAMADALEQGLIGPDCHVMAHGRDDGAGAQAMSRMSALSLARHYGLKYVHAPFRSMDHAECEPRTWAARWEALLNLGKGELQIDACTHLPLVDIEDFMANRELWTRPCVVGAGHFVRFTDRNPAAYLSAIPEFQRKYAGASGRSQRASSIVVGVHVRRGDVSVYNPETSHRTANLRQLQTVVEQVQANVRWLGLRSQVKVFSQGQINGLEGLEDLGCEIHLNTSAISVFKDLADADVLVMGRSSFSFTAALINRGLKIYTQFARAPVPGWLTPGADGRICDLSLTEEITGCAIDRGLLTQKRVGRH